MKTVHLIILFFVIVLLFFFYPRKIDFPSPMSAGLQNLPVPVCHGIYYETYYEYPTDGGKGGWCFGKVTVSDFL